MVKQYIITQPIRKNKKYSVFKWDNKDKKYKYHLSFGDSRYEHYKDKLGLYSHLDHHDADRKRLYYARHGKTNNKDSAKYFANRYLW